MTLDRAKCEGFLPCQAGLKSHHLFESNLVLLNSSLNDFIIGQDSEAINLGSLSGANLVPMDILEVVRTSNPDAGAYQHIEF